MTAGAQLALPLSAPQRNADGTWATRWPGVVVMLDERPRHIVPHAGPLDVDPGPGGSAFGYHFTTGQRPPLGDYRRLHVMSEHAGGEIRGYELEADGTLLLAYPCSTGLWPEMDAEIKRVAHAALRSNCQEKKR